MEGKSKILVSLVASVLKDDYIVYRNWSELAATMGTCQVIITELRNQCQFELKTFYDVLLRIMEDWVCSRGKTGKVTTLGSLFKLLGKIEAIAAIDSLVSKFDDDPNNIVLQFHVKNFRCRNPVHFFTGRTDVSQKICTVFSNSERNDSIQVRGIVVLCGPGGIGKSEAARHFITTHTYLYATNVLWIDATNLLVLRSSFLEIARDLQLKVDETCPIANLVKEIFKWFSNQDILLIFDDAMDFESIRNFIPHEAGYLKPYVIITSQCQTWGSLKSILLRKLSLEESVQSMTCNCSKLSIEHCRLLATELDGFPLALHEAVGYITFEEIDVPKYLELYKRSSKLLGASRWKSYDTSSTYQKSIFTAWDVAKNSFGKDEVGGKALLILRIIAYFSQRTKKHWLLGIGDEEDGEEITTSAFKMLENYCLITIDGDDVEVHSVMQLVVRHDSLHNKLEESILTESFGIIKSRSLQKYEVNLCTNVWQYAAHYPTFLRDEYSSLKYRELSLTPLHLLAEGNHNHEVKTVVNHFKRTKRHDEGDTCGRTALTIAAANGNLDLVRFLLSRNASTKIKFRFPYSIRPFPTLSGLNVLHLPAEYGYLEVVKLLHQCNKALLLKPDDRGRTPVEQASLWGQQDVLDYLIQCKDFDALYKSALRLHCLLCRDHYQLLLRNTGAGFQFNMDGMTSSSLHEVQSFLTGLPLNATKDILQCKVGGNTALRSACYNGDLQLAQFLIEKGASVKGTDGDSPPIDSALACGSLELLQLLLNNGASPEDAPSTGYTALHVAVQRNSREVVQFFFDWYYARSLPLPLHIQDGNGSTLMHTAAAHGHLQMVEYLAKQGVCLDTPTKLGFTPAFAAAANYYPLVFKFFLNATNERREGWQTILDNFGKPSLFSMGQVSVAHVLSIYNDPELLELVLSSGQVSPRIGEDVSVSLLHVAALAGSLECVKLLLNSNELNVNSPVKLREMLANLQKFFSDGQTTFPPVVKTLLSVLTNLRYIVSRVKVTPYMVAYGFGHEEICLQFMRRDDFEQLTTCQRIICAITKKIAGPDTRWGNQLAVIFRQVPRLKGGNSEEHFPSHVAEMFELRDFPGIEGSWSWSNSIFLQIAMLSALASSAFLYYYW